MKLPARFFSMFPELQRELYATPRWWVTLFFLISLALMSAVTAGGLSRGYSNSPWDAVDGIFHVGISIALVMSLLLGLLQGYRLARMTDDGSGSSRPAFRTIFGITMAGMLNVYVFLFSCATCVIAITLYNWDGGLLWRGFNGIIWMEISCFMAASLGIMFGVVSQQKSFFSPRIGSIAIAFIFAVFTLIIILDSYWQPRLASAFIPFISLANVIEISSKTGIPFLVIGIAQQLAISFCALKTTQTSLTCAGGWLFSRKVFFASITTCMLISTCIFFKKALYPQYYHEGITYFYETYFTRAFIALLVSTFVLTPGHNQLRERELRMKNLTRWQRFMSPYGSAYLPVLAGAVILIIPAFYFAAGDGSQFAGHAAMAIILEYAWACLSTAQIEHCELYTRRLGRILALLLILLFLLLPIVAEIPNDYSIYLSPLKALDKFGEEQTLPAMGLQACVIGAIAAGMQIWTDFQRRQMASAQRRRIEEALEIGIRNG